MPMELYAGRPRDDKGERQDPVKVDRPPDPVDGRVGLSAKPAPAKKSAPAKKGDSE